MHWFSRIVVKRAGYSLGAYHGKTERTCNRIEASLLLSALCFLCRHSFCFHLLYKARRVSWVISPFNAALLLEFHYSISALFSSFIWGDCSFPIDRIDLRHDYKVSLFILLRDLPVPNFSWPPLGRTENYLAVGCVAAWILSRLALLGHIAKAPKGPETSQELCIGSSVACAYCSQRSLLSPRGRVSPWLAASSLQGRAGP